ncbi:hypothetical protein ACOSQ3_021517 [Xanthoceras sorbifolium]
MKKSRTIRPKQRKKRKKKEEKRDEKREPAERERRKEKRKRRKKEEGEREREERGGKIGASSNHLLQEVFLFSIFYVYLRRLDYHEMKAKAVKKKKKGGFILRAENILV